MSGGLASLAANTALMAASARGYWDWRRATRHVANVQLAVLRRIVGRNAATSFGQEHRFSDISSVADYQRLVPLRSYADLEPYIWRIAGGESNVLTAEPVVLFQPSSGSTAPSKLVPYTGSLGREFQRGIGPWLCRIYAAWPGLLTGRHYWSITPVGASRGNLSDSHPPGGPPIGFEEDAQYFGSGKRRFIQAIMAVPPLVGRIRDLEAFRYVTLRFLLQCRDLSLVSVWHPSFLTLLLQALPPHASRLISDLAEGGVAPPGSLPAEVGRELQHYLQRDGARARSLARLLEAWDGMPGWRDCRGRSVYEAIWPRLRLISCWADGPASEYAAQLRRLFPNTAVQPKGLLATEGFISFPLGRRVGAALAITSHFFEFVAVGSGDGIETQDAAPLLLAHELEPGQVYSVVITTGGGLYRYRLHDLVEVVGFVNECPLVRFLGKEDSVVDLFGEKLNEGHVRRVVTEQLATYGLAPDFWTVAPERDGDHSAHYTLFVQWRSPGVTGDSGVAPDEASLKCLAAVLEKGLRRNYHYRYCRELGQLKPLRVFLIDGGSGDASARFLEVCQSRGQRLGDVKPTGLHSFPGWGEVFPGRYVSG